MLSLIEGADFISYRFGIQPGRQQYAVLNNASRFLLTHCLFIPVLL